METAVDFFPSEWNCLNVSPDDTVRMYYWLYETKFLAEDTGPARSGQIHFVTSMIKPDRRTGHTFDKLIPFKEIFDQRKCDLNFNSCVTCCTELVLNSCLYPASSLSSPK